MIKLTGLWSNTSKDGKITFLSGNLGGGRIVIMKNNFKKEGSNEPDFNLLIEEQLKKENTSAIFPKNNEENKDVPF